MSKTPEEIAAMEAEIERLKNKESVDMAQLQRLQAEKDAAEALLNSADLRPQNRFNRVQRENGDVTSPLPKESDKDDEVEGIVNKLVSGMTSQEFQDPETLRKVLNQFGKEITYLAFRRATQQSVKTMNDILNVNASITKDIEQWRKDNPDLANPEMEDIVEYFLVKKIHPAFPKLSFREKVDKATVKAREFIDKQKEGGKEEEREATKTVRAQKIVTPTKTRVASQPTKETTLSPETTETDVDRFLQKRREERVKKENVTY